MIRKITLADCQAVGSCHYHCWQETYRGLIADDYLDRMDEKKNMQRFENMFEKMGNYQYVVEVDQEIVGFFDVSPSRDAYAPYEVQGLYLRKAYHGKGYGREIMTAIRRICANEHFYLWCLKNNPTTGYYEHMGGQMIDRRIVSIGGQALEEVCYLF